MFDASLLVIRMLVGYTFLTITSALGIEGLIAAIVLCMVLILVFGGSLIPFLGLITNAGNIFYALVLFGFIILTRKYGKQNARRMTWIVALLIIGFFLFSQLALVSQVSVLTPILDKALVTIFRFNARIALASVGSFLISSNLVITLFDKFKNRSMIERNILSQLGAQAIDTVLFFLVAFAGTLSPLLVFQTIVGGYTMKAISAVVSTPFLYYIDRKWPIL